jgi:hypothetical protein
LCYCNLQIPGHAGCRCLFDDHSGPVGRWLAMHITDLFHRPSSIRWNNGVARPQSSFRQTPKALLSLLDCGDVGSRTADHRRISGVPRLLYLSSCVYIWDLRPTKLIINKSMQSIPLRIHIFFTIQQFCSESWWSALHISIVSALPRKRNSGSQKLSLPHVVSES